MYTRQTEINKNIRYRIQKIICQNFSGLISGYRSNTSIIRVIEVLFTNPAGLSELTDLDDNIDIGLLITVHLDTDTKVLQKK